PGRDGGLQAKDAGADLLPRRGGGGRARGFLARRGRSRGAGRGGGGAGRRAPPIHPVTPTPRARTRTPAAASRGPFTDAPWCPLQKVVWVLAPATPHTKQAQTAAYA